MLAEPLFKFTCKICLFIKLSQMHYLYSFLLCDCIYMNERSKDFFLSIVLFLFLQTCNSIVQNKGVSPMKRAGGSEGYLCPRQVFSSLSFSVLNNSQNSQKYSTLHHLFLFYFIFHTHFNPLILYKKYTYFS